MTATLDVALTVLRVLIGALMFGHGAQKLFGWYGGAAMSGTTGMIALMGFRPARLWALLLALVEVLGGLSLVFGFLVPLGAALLIADMLVAIVKVHAPKGIWNMVGGMEYNLVLIASLVVIGLAGPTTYSIDRSANLVTWTPEQFFFAGTALSLFGAFIALLTTVQPTEQRTTQPR